MGHQTSIDVTVVARIGLGGRLEPVPRDSPIPHDLLELSWD